MEMRKDLVTEILKNYDGLMDIKIVYNRATGKNFMFLVPYSQDLNIKTEYTNLLASIYILDVFDDGAKIVLNYIEAYPDTPFVVYGDTVLDCINLMNEKLLTCSHTDYMIDHEMEAYFKFNKYCRDLTLADFSKASGSSEELKKMINSI